MSVRPLRVFVSSKMQELAEERQAIKAALDDMRIESFVFEADAGARPRTIEETFLEEVEGADLYIGVFWRGYGRYTIEEYDRATALGMDCLIYEKREAVDGQRDPELAAFLERLGDVEAGRRRKLIVPRPSTSAAIHSAGDKNRRCDVVHTGIGRH
jgi:hypothetical protein